MLDGTAELVVLLLCKLGLESEVRCLVEVLLEISVSSYHARLAKHIPFWWRSGNFSNRVATRTMSSTPTNRFF